MWRGSSLGRATPYRLRRQTAKRTQHDRSNQQGQGNPTKPVQGGRPPGIWLLRRRQPVLAEHARRVQQDAYDDRWHGKSAYPALRERAQSEPQHSCTRARRELGQSQTSLIGDRMVHGG